MKSPNEEKSTGRSTIAGIDMDRDSRRSVYERWSGILTTALRADDPHFRASWRARGEGVFLDRNRVLQWKALETS